MAYNVYSPNGNFVVLPQTLDTSNTSLSIPGKDYSGWGQPYAENFTKLVENFAGATPPANSRRGQIWFNTNTNTLQVFVANAYSDLHVVNSDHAASANTANTLTTPRAITLVGDVTGTTVFDGSADVTITAVLHNTGVVAGTYTSPTVTVGPDGRISGITAGVVANTVSTAVTSFRVGSGAQRIGDVQFLAADVNLALGYTPYDPATNAYVRRAGDTMVGNGDPSGSTLTGGLDFNYGPITRAGNITAYGNLRMANPGKQTDFATNRLQNVGNPTVSTDAATKGYVDGRLAGLGGSVTVSTQPPSGGSNGDVWYRY